MHFRASATHVQKPLCFAYKLTCNFKKIQKSNSETLGIHSVFAPESQVAFFALKSNGKCMVVEGPEAIPKATAKAKAKAFFHGPWKNT